MSLQLDSIKEAPRVLLADLGRWTGGGTPSKSRPEYWSGSIPWVSPKDMKVARIRDTEDHITDAAVRESATNLVPAGSILMVTRSGILAHTLPVAITDVQVALNQDLKALTPKSNIDASYVYWAFRTLEREILNSCSKDGTTVASIDTARLMRVEVPLPSIEEQRRIVSAIEEHLSRLDSGIAELRNVERKVGRMQEAILARAALGQLLTPEPYAEPAAATISAYSNLASAAPARTYFSDRLETLPDGWTWTPAHTVCEVIVNGNTPSPTKMTSNGEIPFIKVYNLTKTGSLDFTVKPTFVDRETHSGRLARSRLRPGDVLINIVGPPLGKVAIVPSSYPEWNTNQAVVAFRPLPSLDRQLLVWLLLARPVVGRLIATSKATAGQFNIALNACRALPLPIPPREEQQRLVEALHREFTAIRRMQSTVAVQLTRASQLRRAILSAAFTGRVVKTLGGAQTDATPWSGITPTPIGVGQ